MTKTSLIVLACAAALAIGIHPATAQAPWCLITSDGPGGCSYYTFEQCLASRAGGSSHCGPNPAFTGTRPSTGGSATTGRERRR